MSEREPRLEPPTPEDNEPTGSTPEELNIPAIYGESNPMTEVMTCETPGGSWAWYTDQGVGYSKNENQDAIVVDPENEGMAVIDGMGGHPNGTEAAQILAESLDGHLTGIAQIETGQLSAVDRMQNELDSVESGACYLAAHRTGNRLEILYAGDVRLAKYNPDGAHEFSTEDHGEGRVVRKYVSPSAPTIRGDIIEKPIESGNRIVVASDGLWDNYSETDVGGMLNGLSPQDAVSTVTKALHDKMHQRKNGTLPPDTYAKCDNISILIYDVK